MDVSPRVPDHTSLVPSVIVNVRFFLSFSVIGPVIVLVILMLPFGSGCFSYLFVRVISTGAELVFCSVTSTSTCFSVSAFLKLYPVISVDDSTTLYLPTSRLSICLYPAALISPYVNLAIAFPETFPFASSLYNSKVIAFARLLETILSLLELSTSFPSASFSEMLLINLSEPYLISGAFFL